MAQNEEINMTPQSANVLANVLPGWSSVVQIGLPERAPVFQPVNLQQPLAAIASRKDWLDEEYREAYMEACVEQNIAWQIKFNRERRGITQQQLSEMIGTRQSAISRVEDPSYGKTNLGTLLKIANAFKCALSIKLIPYSALAEESKKFSKENCIVKSFTEEMRMINGDYK